MRERTPGLADERERRRVLRVICAASRAARRLSGRALLAAVLLLASANFAVQAVAHQHGTGSTAAAPLDSGSSPSSLFGDGCSVCRAVGHGIVLCADPASGVSHSAIVWRGPVDVPERPPCPELGAVRSRAPPVHLPTHR